MTHELAPSVPHKDVKWRVDGKPTEKNGKWFARFVPYIDARVAARLMDEWVGPVYWSDSCKEVTIGGKTAILATVSVWNVGLNEWVSKQDVGTASNMESEKGAVSDAFKRVVSAKWGAGRNVYELPTIFAPCRMYERGGENKAAENSESLPFIRQKLKDLDIQDVDSMTIDTSPEAAHEVAVEKTTSAATPAVALTPRPRAERPAVVSEDSAGRAEAVAPEPEIPASIQSMLAPILPEPQPDDNEPVTDEIWAFFAKPFSSLDVEGKRALKKGWTEARPGSPLPVKSKSTKGDVRLLVALLDATPF